MQEGYFLTTLRPPVFRSGSTFGEHTELSERVASDATTPGKGRRVQYPQVNTTVNPDIGLYSHTSALASDTLQHRMNVTFAPLRPSRLPLLPRNNFALACCAVGRTRQARGSVRHQLLDGNALLQGANAPNVEREWRRNVVNRVCPRQRCMRAGVLPCPYCQPQAIDRCRSSASVTTRVVGCGSSASSTSGFTQRKHIVPQVWPTVSIQLYALSSLGSCHGHGAREAGRERGEGLEQDALPSCNEKVKQGTPRVTPPGRCCPWSRIGPCAC